MTCRLCARDRGFSPLQAVLLLGAAFFVILGLKELFSATGRPQSERAVVEAYGPRTSVGSPGGAPAMVPAVPGPTPTPGPERRVPHTPA